MSWTNKNVFSKIIRRSIWFFKIDLGPISVSTVRDAGVFINVPVSISSNINNFKMAGIYRFNPMLSTDIASTMITPMPVFKLDLPVKNMAQFVSIAALASSIGVWNGWYKI